LLFNKVEQLSNKKNQLKKKDYLSNSLYLQSFYLLTMSISINFTKIICFMTHENVLQSFASFSKH